MTRKQKRDYYAFYYLSANETIENVVLAILHLRYFSFSPSALSIKFSISSYSSSCFLVERIRCDATASLCCNSPSANSSSTASVSWLSSKEYGSKRRPKPVSSMRWALSYLWNKKSFLNTHKLLILATLLTDQRKLVPQSLAFPVQRPHRRCYCRRGRSPDAPEEGCAFAVRIADPTCFSAR